jgi:hypothetical protein
MSPSHPELFSSAHERVAIGGHSVSASRRLGHRPGARPCIIKSGTARAIGYRRVSTAEQELGLDAQQAAIIAGAARLDLPLADTFTDAGLSGGLALEQRPALLAALDALGKGDVLIVAKRDRLGRDVLNVAMFERLPHTADHRRGVAQDRVSRAHQPAIAADQRDGAPRAATAADSRYSGGRRCATDCGPPTPGRPGPDASDGSGHRGSCVVD